MHDDPITFDEASKKKSQRYDPLYRGHHFLYYNLNLRKKSTKSASTESTSPVPHDRIGLLCLPNELIKQIAESIDDLNDLFNLVMMNKRLAYLLTPTLHQREITLDKGAWLLHIAIEIKDTERIETLVNIYGADINGAYGSPPPYCNFSPVRAPINHAAHRGDFGCFMKLVELGAKTSSPDQPTCGCRSSSTELRLLYCAIKGGNIDIIKTAWELTLPKEEGEDEVIDKKRLEGLGSLINTASKKGSIEVFKWVLSKGFSINSIDPKTGKTPLHTSGSPEVTRFLLENNANIHAKNNRHKTPEETFHGSIEHMRTLLGCLGDPSDIFTAEIYEDLNRSYDMLVKARLSGSAEV